ncbi:rho guanine nucleotide exchange factor 2-like isoform X1 [Tyto alba]|uniref:rho guanine nucleotide exchange factor 2-like isoform X1 n=1 Tax=Tyto alba TaxID=56313 RepID=UPI001C6704F1|nr:rho guanine nucleotide exchange factor 2-like isoform X1 [Tyto alba]
MPPAPVGAGEHRHLPPAAAPASRPHWGWRLRCWGGGGGGISPAATRLSWLWDDGKHGRAERSGWLLPSRSAPRPPLPGAAGPPERRGGSGVPRPPQPPATMSRVPKQAGAAAGGAAGRPPCRSPVRRPSHLSGQSKEKEKEKMKEGKDKDARYTNGHLFTTITVSGMTMCFACNKSITAKEALICPTCNVTIHNRCKDTLPNCTKVKQKQQKAALLKNSSALQSVSLRNKTAIRERPNSAIYPSESFRQTLLGPRRGRPSLSLSKSVSTTNIAGTFNDESPLGIRRILSQSTDSLNMRNRTLSVESLIDEGPDVILTS